MTSSGSHRAAATARCAAALFLGAAIPATGWAQSLQVDAAPCAKSIRIQAQDVPLGDIVKRVAQSLEIRLEAKTDLPEPVSFNGSGTPEEVLKRLLHGRNLVLDSNKAGRCGGREVLTTMWVLPAGEDVPRAAAPPAPPGPVVQQAGEVRPVQRPPRPRGTRKRMTEEEWQQAKKDYMAGKTQADPETGLPIPVEPAPAPQPAP